MLPEQQPFVIGDFLESIGNTVQSGIDNIGGNFDANSANAMAIARINAEKAAAVKSDAENRKLIVRYIFATVLLVIIAVTATNIISKIVTKKK